MGLSGGGWGLGLGVGCGWWLGDGWGRENRNIYTGKAEFPCSMDLNMDFKWGGGLWFMNTNQQDNYKPVVVATALTFLCVYVCVCVRNNAIKRHQNYLL